ncbi:hypothetical protein VTO73DRAFT_5673 [Trametes versicolor]
MPISTQGPGSHDRREADDAAPCASICGCESVASGRFAHDRRSKTYPSCPLSPPSSPRPTSEYSKRANSQTHAIATPAVTSLSSSLPAARRPNIAYGKPTSSLLIARY